MAVTSPQRAPSLISDLRDDVAPVARHWLALDVDPADQSEAEAKERQTRKVLSSWIVSGGIEKRVTNLVEVSIKTWPDGVWVVVLIDQGFEKLCEPRVIVMYPTESSRGLE